MKAVVLSGFDGAPAVTELDVPEPGPGEVRVRVRAASINGFDVAVANGYLKGAMEHRFPVVLGKDFAGTVEAVGEGATGYGVGDQVFGVVTKDFLGDGSFGQYVTVPTAVGIAKLPERIGFTEAAALGLAGTAAADAVEAADIVEGSTVLIVGATGGVGQQAIQLAVRGGARVTASAHAPEEIEKVRELGAARTVDHTGDLAAQVREEYPDGVDAVLHLAGDPSGIVSLVKPGGVFVSTIVLNPAQVPAEGIRVAPVYAQPTTATLEKVAADHASGRTVVTVQRVYDLDETPEALGHFAAGTLGKLVIAID